MSLFAHVDGLGALVEECISDALLDWRREFRPGPNVVDTIAEHLQDVQTSVSLRRAGVVMITVQVKGKGFLETSTACFRAKRVRLGEWRRTASSLDRHFR
jgi:hypothetical protein